MREDGGIDAALQKLGPGSTTKKGRGLLGDIEGLSEGIRRYPWTTLASIKGDPQVIRRLKEIEKLLKDLKKTLSRWRVKTFQTSG